MQCGDGRPANVITFPKVPRKRRPVAYHLSGDDDVPPDASTWADSRAFNAVIEAWLRAMCRHFDGNHGRVHQLAAWLSRRIHPKKFYCWANDATLARYVNSTRIKVNESLAVMAREGAIIRAVYVDDSGRKRRRIFLNRAFVGIANTPRTHRHIPRSGDTVAGTQNLNNKGPLFGGKGVGE